MMDLKTNQKTQLEWLETDLGKYILRQESEEIFSLLKDVFFKKVLMMVDPCFALASNLDFLEHSRIMYKIMLCSSYQKQLLESQLILSQGTKKQILVMVSKLDQISVDNDSIDLVILPHSLEIVIDPYKVLKESYRVLRPGGIIILTGFNLLSIWGIWRLIVRKFIASPWQNKFYSVTKIFNWLDLLGFDELKVRYYCYNLPINNNKLLKTFSFLEKTNKLLSSITGNIYTICACKKVTILTPKVIGGWDKIHITDNEIVKNILKN